MTINLNRLFILCLFYLAPIIDAVSGYLILSELVSEGGTGSPSQVFRLLVLIIMLFILLQNKRFVYIASFLIGYLILIELYFFMVHQNIYGVVIGLIYGNKISYLLMIFFTLYLLIKKHLLSPIKLLMHVRNYVAITAVILVGSFVSGSGFHTYGEGTFGVKGFFAAGNGLGIFMGAGLLLSIYYWNLTRERYSLELSLLILFGTIVIGSKTALLLSLVGFVSIVVLLGNAILILSMFFLALIVIGTYFNEIIKLFVTVFDVILFRLENSDSILSWVFSNRDNYFIEAIDTVSFENYLLIRLFIGFGAYISFRDPYGFYSTIDILESDIVDLFFMYGAIMVAFYIVFVIKGIYQGILYRNFFLTLIFTLLMGHSFMAGHVIFNGMSGVLVPILFLLLLVMKKDIRCRK